MASKKNKKPRTAPDSKKKYTLNYTEQFFKDYKRATPQQQKDGKSTLALIEETGDFTPGNERKKLPGTDIWYIRAGSDTRITFTMKKGGVLFVRRIGPHPILDAERKAQK